MKKGCLLLLTLGALVGTAHASSDEAWAKGDQAMKTACLKASQLKNPQIASGIMLFDDSVGYSSVVISGRYPQAQMKNQRGRELCLWQRATQKAHVTEADTLLTLKR